MIIKNLQKKLTFLVFTILVAVMVSGAVSAALQGPADYSSAYVVENGYSFTGPASIQDAADNYETLGGYNIELETGTHEEQVVVNKNLNIKGMGTSPEETVIQSSDETGTIVVSPGMTLVLENLSIWNYATTNAIVNNGQLTIINCFVNGDFIANEVTGAAAGAEETPDETSTPEDTNNANEPLTVTGEEDTTTTSGGTGTTTSTETSTSGNTEGTEEPATDDLGIPLGSLASGMLMLMGGTVAGRKHE